MPPRPSIARPRRKTPTCEERMSGLRCPGLLSPTSLKRPKQPPLGARANSRRLSIRFATAPTRPLIRTSWSDSLLSRGVLLIRRHGVLERGILHRALRQHLGHGCKIVPLLGNAKISLFQMLRADNRISPRAFGELPIAFRFLGA